MALYNNLRTDSPIATLEFSPTIDGNFSFFGVRNTADLPAIKETLAKLGQKILAETTVNGHPMLVTQGKRTDYSLLSALTDQGNNFKPPAPDKALNMWKLRGWASMIGQPMQLLSAYLQPKGIDMGVAGFASLNIIANIANIAFGAEKSSDINQLRFLKRKFNYELSKYLPDGATTKLPSSYDDRYHLRVGKEAPPSFGSKVAGFLRRHSVSFCEIGLRYLGSVMLIFPINKWRDGFSAFGDSLRTSNKGFKGFGSSILDGAAGAFNNDKLSAKAGMAYVAGKSLAFTSKVADPYDTKPHTWLDTAREKVVFPLSSAIEALAALIISYNGLRYRKLGYAKIVKPLQPLFKRFAGHESELLNKLGAKETRDWFGGLGGLLFTSGLIIRMFAPFGKREVDLKELNAHIVDGLAQIPPEKLPQVIADFSSFLTQHFKEAVEFGAVYKELSDGLYHHHSIPLPNIGVITPEADLQADALRAAKTEEPTKQALNTIEHDIETVEAKEKTFANESLKTSDKTKVKAPDASHAQRALASEPSERTASIH